MRRDLTARYQTDTISPSMGSGMTAAAAQPADRVLVIARWGSQTRVTELWRSGCDLARGVPPAFGGGFMPSPTNEGYVYVFYRTQQME